MKKVIFTLLLLIVLFLCAAQAEGQLPYRFADAQEGRALLLSNEDYFARLSRQDLDYRLQKKGGTVEEYKAFAASQVLSFTDAEKQVLAASFARIEKILSDNGYVLPAIDEIVLIKTTMQEEGNAGAYTHGTQIYLGDGVLSYGFHEDPTALYGLDGILCHEIFHCLTRSNAAFRAAAYGLIGFSVQEEDYPLPPALQDQILSNPDVERRNASAPFMINGQETRCYMVALADKPFEQAGDSFMGAMTSALIPVDQPDVIYTPADAENFYDLFGQNTGYVIDPEECLADNFRFAVVFGLDGLGGMVTFPTPQLLENLLGLLKP